MVSPFLLAMVAVGAGAGPSTRAIKAQSPVAVAPGLAPRNYLQSAYTRLRPASLLKAGAREARPLPPELRGSFSLDLDGENQKHYARIAELDILLDLASKQKLLALEERADATTRREMSRYFRRLQVLRAHAIAEERSRL